MEESLACAKLNTLPGEIYVCGGTGELAAVNGVYRMEAQSGNGAANQEYSPSPIFKKGEGSSFFAIAKVRLPVRLPVVAKSFHGIAYPWLAAVQPSHL